MKPFTCFSEFSYLLTLLTCLLLLIYSSDIRRFDRKPWHCCFPRPISIFPPFITEISLKKHEKCSFLVNQRIWWMKCMWLTVKHDLPQQVAICQQAKRMRRMRMRGGIQKKIHHSVYHLTSSPRQKRGGGADESPPFNAQKADRGELQDSKWRKTELKVPLGLIFMPCYGRQQRQQGVVTK